MERANKRETIILIIKIILSLGLIISSIYVGLISFVLSLMITNVSGIILSVASIFFLPSILPFIWVEKRKKYLTYLTYYAIILEAAE